MFSKPRDEFIQSPQQSAPVVQQPTPAPHDSSAIRETDAAVLSALGISSYLGLAVALTLISRRLRGRKCR